MRPRVSLKWLLIAVTVASVALFVLVIYPTNKARSFVAGVNTNGIDLSELLATDLASLNQALPQLSDKDRGAKTITAELLGWSWGDLLRMRRRVEVTEKITRGSWEVVGASTADYQTTAQIGVSPVGQRLIRAEVYLLAETIESPESILIDAGRQ